MNIGKGRWHSRYVCDKCNKEIQYIDQKGFVGINHYYKSTQRETIKRNFDLCSNCEKKFREWLKTKEMPEVKDIVNNFPIYRERSNYE